MTTSNLNATIISPALSSVSEKSVTQEDEWFDLQPIEKKLCGYSFGLGIALLIVFILAFEVF